MRHPKSRRNLAFFGALYPYLGGKRRLCPLIFREIDRVIPRRLWGGLTLLDAFSGGGAVSLYAKALGFRVVAADIAERARVIGEGLVANSRVRLTREDILRLLAPRTGAPGRVESGYAPAAFTAEQACLLDSAMEAAERTPDPAKAALYRLLAIRVAMLAHPLSQVRPGTIERVTSGGWESVSEKCVKQYVDGPRLLRPEKLWALAQRINAGVFEGQGRFVKGDIFDLLPTVQTNVAYFDPPYANTRSYEAEYKTLDAILGDSARPVSAFSRKDGAGLVDEILKRAAHIPIWVLSFGNAAVDLQDLEAKMKTLGRETRATAVRYAHKASIASAEKIETNREFVVVGWDPTSTLVRDAVRIGDVGNDALVPLHADPHLVSPEGTATLGLLSDRLEQGEATRAKERASKGRGIAAPNESRVDDPDAVLREAGVDGDGEGRLER